MTTIKSYTDIEQSKKLAEILPHESADYFHAPDAGVIITEPYKLNEDDETVITAYKGAIPCWSLSALLNVLKHPRCFQGDKPTYWFCGCFGKDKLYHEVEADNPIDACVEMIIKLHENNKL